MEFGTFMSDTVVPIIADVVGQLSAWINTMQMTGTTSGIFETIRNAIAAIPGVLAQMSAGLATVQTFLQPLTDAVMNFVGVFVPAITSAGMAIAEYLGSPQVSAFITTLSTFFLQLATTVQDILVLAFQGATIAWTYLSQAFTIMWPYIQTVLDTFLSSATIVINFVTGLLTALSQLVKGDFSGAFETMKKTVGTALTDLWEFFKTLDKNLLTFFDEIKPKVLQLGTDMVQGIADGIKSGASWIKDALLQAARDAWSAVTSYFSGQGSDGDGEDAPSTTGRASLTGSTNSNGTTYYLNMTANYGSQQSESSLISDAKAWMMTIGAGQ